MTTELEGDEKKPQFPLKRKEE
jgi:hypothetical protein